MSSLLVIPTISRAPRLIVRALSKNEGIMTHFKVISVEPHTASQAIEPREWDYFLKEVKTYIVAKLAAGELLVHADQGEHPIKRILEGMEIAPERSPMFLAKLQRELTSAINRLVAVHSYFALKSSPELALHISPDHLVRLLKIMDPEEPHPEVGTGVKFMRSVAAFLKENTPENSPRNCMDLASGTVFLEGKSAQDFTENQCRLVSQLCEPSTHFWGMQCTGHWTENIKAIMEFVNLETNLWVGSLEGRGCLIHYVGESREMAFPIEMTVGDHRLPPFESIPVFIVKGPFVGSVSIAKISNVLMNSKETIVIEENCELVMRAQLEDGPHPDLMAKAIKDRLKACARLAEEEELDWPRVKNAYLSLLNAQALGGPCMVALCTSNPPLLSSKHEGLSKAMRSHTSSACDVLHGLIADLCVRPHFLKNELSYWMTLTEFTSENVTFTDQMPPAEIEASLRNPNVLSCVLTLACLCACSARSAEGEVRVDFEGMKIRYVQLIKVLARLSEQMLTAIEAQMQAAQYHLPIQGPAPRVLSYNKCAQLLMSQYLVNDGPLDHANPSVMFRHHGSFQRNMFGYFIKLADPHDPGLAIERERLNHQLTLDALNAVLGLLYGQPPQDTVAGAARTLMGKVREIGI